ncbi:hypothetical protein B0H19DRAFT_1333964 [Mycena capillaripes]|nr:hypothetical protein B0H19DRAFT_1333964 [Mycena capillaripes]
MANFFLRHGSASSGSSMSLPANQHSNTYFKLTDHSEDASRRRRNNSGNGKPRGVTAEAFHETITPPSICTGPNGAVRPKGRRKASRGVKLQQAGVCVLRWITTSLCTMQYVMPCGDSPSSRNLDIVFAAACQKDSREALAASSTEISQTIVAPLWHRMNKPCGIYTPRNNVADNLNAAEDAMCESLKIKMTGTFSDKEERTSPISREQKRVDWAAINFHSGEARVGRDSESRGARSEAIVAA